MGAFWSVHVVKLASVARKVLLRVARNSGNPNTSSRFVKRVQRVVGLRKVVSMKLTKELLAQLQRHENAGFEFEVAILIAYCSTCSFKAAAGDIDSLEIAVQAHNCRLKKRPVASQMGLFARRESA